MMVAEIHSNSQPKEEREVLSFLLQDTSSILKGLKALVIDDNLDSLELVKMILEESEILVITAESASEGLKLFTQFNPDILICDITMPVENGYSVIRKIRNLQPEQGGQIPAIALTACARDEDLHLALEAGYQIHLAKPIDLDELLRLVASLTRRNIP